MNEKSNLWRICALCWVLLVWSMCDLWMVIGALVNYVFNNSPLQHQAQKYEKIWNLWCGFSTFVQSRMLESSSKRNIQNYIFPYNLFQLKLLHINSHCRQPKIAYWELAGKHLHFLKQDQWFWIECPICHHYNCLAVDS